MSSRSLKVISHEEYKAWFHQHYAILRHRSPFHHPDWLEAVARGVQFDAVFIGIYEGREMVSALPGFLTRRGPVRLFGSPLRGAMTSYLGPVSLEPIQATDELVDLIANASSFIRQSWGVAYTRFTMRDAPLVNEPGLPVGWFRTRGGSYRLDLSRGKEALWEGLKSDCRRNIRRAQQSGIEIVPLEDGRLFYEMIEATLRRHGTTSFHKERFFQSLLAQLLPVGLLWAWGARYEGAVVAGGLFLRDDREVHYISGASLPQFGSLPTSYLLHWRAIETGANTGLQVFNSDASRVRSIDQFKESFRPTFTKRYTLTWMPSYIRLAQKVYFSAYSRLRALNSRVSLGAIRRQLLSARGAGSSAE